MNNKLSLFRPLSALLLLTQLSLASENSPYFQIHGKQQIDSFPLKSSHHEVTITGPIAQVQLSQTYHNFGNTPIDATYIFPASTKTAIHGMTMNIGKRQIIAEIQEKEKAEATFKKAKNEKKAASLLTQKRPNLFSLEVTRILPGEELSIILTYSEILTPHSGIYEFVTPTAIGPRYGGEETQAKSLHNPFLNKADSIPTRVSLALSLTSPLPIKSLTCPSHHHAQIHFDSQTEAKLTLPPSPPDRDFILRYQLAGNKIQSGLLTHEAAGENTLLLQVEPPHKPSSQDIPARDFIFVVDVSGSMSGFPLQLAQDLFRKLSETLRPEDHFNMLLFAGANELLSDQNLPASSANIERAIAFLKNSRGGGGTELLKALDRALDLPHDHDRARSLVLISDGFISAESAVFDLIKRKAKGTNIFPLGVGSSVNRHLIEGLSHFAGNDHLIVTHPSESAEASERFRQSISWPVLTNIQVKAEGISLHDFVPARLPDLFAGQPLSLIAKWSGDSTGASITMTGTTGGGKKISKSFPLIAKQSEPTLPTLWARQRVRELSDFATLSDRESEKTEITRLGLKHQLLTPYTSFVAISPEPCAHHAPSTTVMQPLALPHGLSNSAKTSGSSGSVPEPTLGLLSILVAILTLGLRIRRSSF